MNILSMKDSFFSIEEIRFLIVEFSFDFCGTEGESSPTENLGQVLFGERIRPSPYKVHCCFFSFSMSTHCLFLSCF